MESAYSIDIDHNHQARLKPQLYRLATSVFDLETICDFHRSKIDKVTLNALRTRQSLVKGERLVRHDMRAVLPFFFRHVLQTLPS